MQVLALQNLYAGVSIVYLRDQFCMQALDMGMGAVGWFVSPQCRFHQLMNVCCRQVDQSALRHRHADFHNEPLPNATVQLIVDWLIGDDVTATGYQRSQSAMSTTLTARTFI